MVDITVAWINELISKNKLYSFYKSPEWLALRGQVMADNHNECRVCARPWEFPELCGKETAARYRRAQTVHHVYTVKVRDRQGTENRKPFTAMRQASQ